MVSGLRLSDAEYMDRALFHARRGLGRTSPNPMVGAVVVTPDDVVVGTGYHERAGEAHAEVHALRAAGAAARGATLYCTLEPCSHIGRTGPCTERIVEAGIARVVASHEDPNPLVAGGGFRYLRDHGVRVDAGIQREAAVRLNAGFLSTIRRRRPFVTLKIALSQDGRIAEAPGRRTTLTSPASHRHAHLRRAEADAIAVGSETIMVDDPQLTVRGVYRERPFTRVVLDRRLRIPPACRLLSTLDAGPVIIMSSQSAVRANGEAVAALEAAGARVEALPDGSDGSSASVASGAFVASVVSMTSAFERLVALGVNALILEGGIGVQRVAWNEGLIDRLHVYQSPRILGEGGVRWFDEMPRMTDALHDVRREQIGDDSFIEGYVHRID